MARIHRAIVSVSDKTGVAQFCAALSRLGVELYASGDGEAAAGEEGPGAPHRGVHRVPEMLDGG